MINLSIKLLEFSKRGVSINNLDKAVNYICDITFKDGETIRGKLIKKEVRDIKTDYSGFNRYIYNPIYNDNGVKLLQTTSRGYAFMCLDKRTIYDIKHGSKMVKKFLYFNLGRNTSPFYFAEREIDSISIVNDFKAKINKIEELPELLNLGNLRIKLRPFLNEIEGVLLYLDIGDNFVDYKGNVYGAAYNYAFMFDQEVTGIGTFIYINSDNFNNPNNIHDFESIEYIRRD